MQHTLFPEVLTAHSSPRQLFFLPPADTGQWRHGMMGVTRGEEMMSRTGVQSFWEVYMRGMGYVQGGQIRLWAELPSSGHVLILPGF